MVYGVDVFDLILFRIMLLITHLVEFVDPLFEGKGKDRTGERKNGTRRTP